MRRQSHETLARTRRRIILLSVAAVVVFVAVGLAAEKPFLKIPYIQNVTKTSAVVMWETPAPAEYVVTWSQNGREVGRKTGKAADKIGEVTIDRLEPDTLCTYAVKIDGVERGGTFQSFPDRVIPFRFIAYSDTQDTYPYNPPLHRKMAGIFTKLKPRLVIHSGDLLDSAGNYSRWSPAHFGPLEGFGENVAIFPTPGNHSHGSGVGGVATWYLKFLSLRGNELWYSFDFANVHFVSIDSELLHFPSEGKLAEEQLKWLEADLKTSKATWKVAYFHRSPFKSGGHGTSIAVRRKFVPLFDKYGVDIVFNGHDHCYHRSIPLKNGKRDGRGTVYMTTGISRGRGYSPGFHLVYASSQTSFATVDVTADRMSILIRDELLNEIDRLVLTKSDAYLKEAEALARSVDVEKRLEAVRDLAALDNGTSGAALRRLLKDADKKVAGAALLALAKTGQLDTSELFAASSNPAFASRVHKRHSRPADLAIMRIYEKPHDEQMALAKKLLRQRGDAPKTLAVRFLANVATDEAVGLLAEVAKSDRKSIRGAVAECLGQIFDPYSDPYGPGMGLERFLTEHLAEFPGRVQSPGKIYAMLLGLMDDEDAGVAGTARVSFMRMASRRQFHHEAASACVERLMKMTADADAKLRAKAVNAVALLPCSDRADAVFLKALADDELIVMSAAISALDHQAQARGHLVKTSGPLLIKALDRGHWWARQKTMWLLRKLTGEKFRRKAEWQKWAADKGW